MYVKKIIDNVFEMRWSQNRKKNIKIDVVVQTRNFTKHRQWCKIETHRSTCYCCCQCQVRTLTRKWTDIGRQWSNAAFGNCIRRITVLVHVVLGIRLCTFDRRIWQSRRRNMRSGHIFGNSCGFAGNKRIQHTTGRAADGGFLTHVAFFNKRRRPCWR